MSSGRAESGLVALLLALAAASWWSTVDRMQRMDAGPWTSLGPLAWFLGVWEEREGRAASGEARVLERRELVGRLGSWRPGRTGGLRE
jgi:hypothetical protein